MKSMQMMSMNPSAMGGMKGQAMSQMGNPTSQMGNPMSQGSMMANMNPMNGMASKAMGPMNQMSKMGPLNQMSNMASQTSQMGSKATGPMNQINNMVSQTSSTGSQATQTTQDGTNQPAEEGKASVTEGPPNEMAEAAAQWSRHAAFTASRAAQAAQYAAQQAQLATSSAQNAVAQMNFLMKNPDVRSAEAASQLGMGAFGFAATVFFLQPPWSSMTWGNNKMSCDDATAKVARAEATHRFL